MQVTNNANISTYSTQKVNSPKNTLKPIWNGNKVYTYLEDYNDAAISYGKQAAMYYSGITNQDGAMSVDDLKNPMEALLVLIRENVPVSLLRRKPLKMCKW